MYIGKTTCGGNAPVLSIFPLHYGGLRVKRRPRRQYPPAVSPSGVLNTNAVHSRGPASATGLVGFDLGPLTAPNRVGITKHPPSAPFLPSLPSCHAGYPKKSILPSPAPYPHRLVCRRDHAARSRALNSPVNEGRCFPPLSDRRAGHNQKKNNAPRPTSEANPLPSTGFAAGTIRPPPPVIRPADESGLPPPTRSSTPGAPSASPCGSWPGGPSGS